MGRPECRQKTNSWSTYFSVPAMLDMRVGKSRYSWMVGWKDDSRLTSITRAVDQRTSDDSIFFSRSTLLAPAGLTITNKSDLFIIAGTRTTTAGTLR